ncbi:glutamyl-tRNA(Gln) amidotransferase subunit C, chloroplastic/mitochondrial-like isoform X1 [Phragmites australis]|uniref:glutamyl-tRNA(Gln) amidotransferase subunit C, chloroplastic/mitochondrial-like isoform X1 n=1 Tax=Phragmites australis TaxID=29695 RepID=UPI002D771E82|nr:glutamyl-tRNA(Gln) amidotransferase subunit C, chloroplastic/mitochondrial-like isoform X1 [Phragmites australis]
MLHAAVSAIPRLRVVPSPLPLRRPSAGTHLVRPLSSSAPHVTPALELPDLPRLANAARISLSPQEAEEFAPKIRQVVDWFGQLQAVDLGSIEPSLRAGLHLVLHNFIIDYFSLASLDLIEFGTTAGSSLREDKPETFANTWKQLLFHIFFH